MYKFKISKYDTQGVVTYHRGELRCELRLSNTENPGTEATTLISI